MQQKGYSSSVHPCPACLQWIQMPAALTPVDCVIRAFGGVRRTARALHRQPGAVIKWRARGLVPNALQAEILALAQTGSIVITAEMLILGQPAT